MRRSDERILTTHAGSLTRPDALREAWSKPVENAQQEAALQALLRKSVADIVAEQVATGIDIPNDGEFGKPMRSAHDLAAWGTYIFGRLSGLGKATNPAPERGIPGQRMRIVGQRWELREFGDFYATAMANVPSVASRPACIGPLGYIGTAALQTDLTNLNAAAEAAKVREAFVTSISVGSLEMFCRGQNEHYASEEAFLEGIATALRVEYRAIVDAGFILQLDDPGLPDTWDMLDPHPTVTEYQRYALLRVEAQNHALDGIAEDRVRYHMCWGSWQGPHTTDIALRDIVEVMLKVKAQAYSIEAGNVRHEHEYKVWREAKLPAGKILIPGVVSHATNVVEHPELVADRLVAYANAVGRENVIAGTDCGLGGRVHPQIAQAKFKALNEGARRASRQLWR
jgi:5-methyltetrahydropteroyltriglutamate--homocysteine methyltransferase